MKTLIVYYSFTHNNEMLAKELQKRLSCDILKIEEVKKRTGFTIALDLLLQRKPRIQRHHVDLQEYRHFIFIAPVWAGKIASPLKTFLLEEKQDVESYSFITVCGGGNNGQKTKINNELSLLLQKEPEIVTELWTNDLLSQSKKDTVKYTSGYRLEAKDFERFEKKIAEFIKTSKVEAEVHSPPVR